MLGHLLKFAKLKESAFVVQFHPPILKMDIFILLCGSDWSSTVMFYNIVANRNGLGFRFQYGCWQPAWILHYGFISCFTAEQQICEHGFGLICNMAAGSHFGFWYLKLCAYINTPPDSQGRFCFGIKAFMNILQC